MATTLNLAVIHGDVIGQEVVPEGLYVGNGGAIRVGTPTRSPPRSA